MGKMDSVIPEKLSLDSRIKFRCHKGIKCFTRCCSNIDVLLTPYDVVCLKKRLNLSSEEFLRKHTRVEIDKKSSHPMLYLMMSEDNKKKCPFVSDEGCTVYTDRPASCRYYPVGQGTMRKQGKDGPVEEEFYFLVREPHCYGFDEKKTWTIQSWREDQEVDRYDRVNRDWKAIQMRKNLPGGEGLDEKKQMIFFMASYNTDQFRRFIFESNFLKVFDIDDETVQKLKDDDMALIAFGARYIKYVMMMEETLKLRDNAANYRKKKQE